MQRVTKSLYFVFITFLSISILPFMSIKVDAAGWGFKKNGDHLTPDIGSYKTEIEGTSSYYVGDASKNEVYLTFDAGYDNGELPKILEILRQKKVRATFFLTGDFVNRFPELCQKIVSDGHLVGNHTYSHRSINTLTKSELAIELVKLQDKFFEVTKTFMPNYFRPPGGVFDRESLLTIQSLGYKTIFWSIAFKDWHTDRQRGSEFSYESVINNLHPGAIILMHTVSQSNREALGSIIDEIRRQDYQFKTVNEL